MYDASDTIVGDMLGQRKEKMFHTIYYFSRTLNESQQNYTTREKELWAIVFAFDKCNLMILKHVRDQEKQAHVGFYTLSMLVLKELQLNLLARALRYLKCDQSKHKQHKKGNENPSHYKLNIAKSSMTMNMESLLRYQFKIHDSNQPDPSQKRNRLCRAEVDSANLGG
ncbi:hypothetical protein CR513_34488, partial [Mucuna pruriens]